MWNENQKKIFGNAYIMTCKMFDKDINFEMAKFVVKNLEDLDFEKSLAALNIFVKDPKNKFWPKVAEIRSIVSPQLSKNDQANAIASNIRQAISRHGWSNLHAAKDELGAIAWEIVERCGGWKYICENHGVELNPLTFYAQSRDLAKSLLESEQNNLKENEQIDYKKNDIINVTKLLIKEMPK